MFIFYIIFLIFTYFVPEWLLQLQRQLMPLPRCKLSTGFPQVYPHGPEKPREARGAMFPKVIEGYAYVGALGLARIVPKVDPEKKNLEISKVGTEIARAKTMPSFTAEKN